MRSVIIEGIFNNKFFDFQGYDLIVIGKRKAMSEKFKASLDVAVDPMLMVEVCEQKGTVYAFRKKGRIKSVYLIRRDGNRFTCSECFYSSDILKLPVIDLMDQKIAFETAQFAYSVKDGVAVFKDTVMPKLVRKEHGFNWGMCITFACIYGVAFNTAVKTSGIFIGIAFGIAMGLCLRDVDFHYEGHEGGKPLGNSASEGV